MRIKATYTLDVEIDAEDTQGFLRLQGYADWLGDEAAYDFGAEFNGSTFETEEVK